MAKLTKDEVVEACARAAHEVNRAYCIALGDTSQVSWDEAPDWQKSSARLGAIGVIDHGNGPKDSHDSWLKQKEAEGWKYGPVNSTLRHPSGTRTRSSFTGAFSIVYRTSMRPRTKFSPTWKVSTCSARTHAAMRSVASRNSQALPAPASPPGNL